MYNPFLYSQLTRAADHIVGSNGVLLFAHCFSINSRFWKNILHTFNCFEISFLIVPRLLDHKDIFLEAHASVEVGMSVTESVCLSDCLSETL